MSNLMFLCQSGIWPILCQLMAIFANLLDMNFKFVFPCIYINFDIQTNFEFNQTKIGHSILQKSEAFFGFWAQIFFGGLNQKIGHD